MYHDHIKDYFPIDPMLLKLFVYLAPKKDFQALCERVPPYLTAELLVEQTKSAGRVEVNITNCVLYTINA